MIGQEKEVRHEFGKQEIVVIVCKWQSKPKRNNWKSITTMRNISKLLSVKSMHRNRWV